MPMQFTLPNTYQSPRGISQRRAQPTWLALLCAIPHSNENQTKVRAVGEISATQSRGENHSQRQTAVANPRQERE